MYVKVWCESDGRRTPGYNSATAVGMIATQRLGIAFLTYLNIYRDQHNGCQYWQRQKLTQHAVVRPMGRHRHVPVTIVMHTIGAFRLYALASFMDVNR
jgi:hypothetical protein